MKKLLKKLFFPSEVRPARAFHSREVENKLFQESPIGMLLVGSDLKIIKVNQALCDLLGYQTVELLEKPLIQMTHPDCREANLTLFNQFFSGTENQLQLETIYLSKTEKICPVNINLSVIRNKKSKIIYSLAIIENILKLNEEFESRKIEGHNPSQDEKKLLEAVLQQIPAAVIVGDALTGKVLFSNNKIGELWRQPRNTSGNVVAYEEWKGFHSDGRPYLASDWPLARSIAHGEIITNESIEVLRRDDTPGTLRFNSAPVRNRTGQIIAGIMICEDFAERKKVDMALITTEERLRTLVTNAPVILYTLDRQGLFTYCDGKGLKSITVKPQHVVNLSAFQLFREVPWITESINRALSGETFTVEGMVGAFAYETHMSPLRNTRAEVTGIIGVALDITSRKKIDEERSKLIGREQAALEASRLKSEFLAQMSHEIRTPLNGIIGLTSLILSTSLNTEQKADFEMLKDSADSLLSVINSILDISKVESGKVELENIEFDLEKTILDTEKMLSQAAIQKGISLRTDCTVNLPFLLRGDPGRLRQILVNLISNAIKFTDQGEVLLKMKLQFEKDNSIELRFEVQDSGIGIPENALNKIFQAFSQADSSTTRRYGGTGLGLTICKQIVELMEGTIGVTSIEGKGSTFWFVLRMKRGALKTKLQKAPSEQIAWTRHRNQSILIAEDNPINQKVAVRMLEKLGFHTHTVTNGNEVLSALKENTYDLILMDCQMPELDGYKTTQIIRGSAPHKQINIPIIAMTANAVKGDKDRCLEVGMNDYINKPFSTSLLLETLEKWVKPPTPMIHSINQTTLAKLRTLDGSDNPEQVKEFIRVFFQTTPERLMKIRDSIRKNQSAPLFHEVHTLKSSCAYLGAHTMEALCRQLEELSSKGRLEGAEQLLVSLENESKQTILELQNIYQNLESEIKKAA